MGERRVAVGPGSDRGQASVPDGVAGRLRLGRWEELGRSDLVATACRALQHALATRSADPDGAADRPRPAFDLLRADAFFTRAAEAALDEDDPVAALEEITREAAGADPAVRPGPGGAVGDRPRGGVPGGGDR